MIHEYFPKRESLGILTNELFTAELFLIARETRSNFISYVDYKRVLEDTGNQCISYVLRFE